MIIKYAILLAVVLVLAVVFAAWAFLPARHLPGNRARHLRIRLHLRLHPGKGFAHALQPVAALVPLRGPAPLRPDPPRPPTALQPAGSGRALGVPRPCPLPAPAARPARRAPARHGPAADLQDRVPGRRDHRVPRPGHRHHHQTRHLRPDQRGACAPRSGARLQPAAHRRRPVHLLLVAHRRMRGPGHRHPPRRRVRVRRVAEGRGGRLVLVRQGLGLPARLLPRRRPGRLRPAHRRRLGLRRRPRRPRTDPGRRRRPPVGRHPGRAPLRGPQDHGDGPNGHVESAGFHGRPRSGRLRPARPRRRLRHSRSSCTTPAPCT